jgi:hypothetical protein
MVFRPRSIDSNFQVVEELYAPKGAENTLFLDPSRGIDIFDRKGLLRLPLLP